MMSDLIPGVNFHPRAVNVNYIGPSPECENNVT